MTTIPNDWFATERGNTWLISGENDAHIIWVDLPDGSKLEVSVCTKNYPGVGISILSEDEATNESIQKRIAKYYDGWYARKCNIPNITIDSENYICGEGETM